MNSIKINETERTITQINKSIREKIEPYSNYPKIIILGTNDSSKSQLIEDLVNKPDDNHRLIDESTYIYFDNIYNVVFCNAPEFEKEQGLNQELINSSIINEMLEKNTNYDNKIKIILVVSSYNFKDRTMLQKITNSFEILQKMIPKTDELKESFGIVISQCCENDIGINYIKNLNDRPSPYIAEWCEYLIENEDRIFTFPQIHDQNNFKDKERLINFIQSGYIVNPSHQISLCKKALKQVENIRTCNYKNIDINIGNIFDKIGEKFQKENRTEELKKCLDKLNEFKSQDNLEINKLELFIKDNIQMNTQILSFLKQIKESEKNDSSLDNILKCQSPSSKLSKTLQVYINKAINQINFSYNQAIKMEIQKRENEEQLLMLQKTKQDQEKQQNEMDDYCQKIELIQKENELKEKEIKILLEEEALKKQQYEKYSKQTQINEYKRRANEGCLLI